MARMKFRANFRRRVQTSREGTGEKGKTEKLCSKEYRARGLDQEGQEWRQWWCGVKSRWGGSYFNKDIRLASEDNKLCGPELITESIHRHSQPISNWPDCTRQVSKAEPQHKVKGAEGSRYPSNCISKSLLQPDVKLVSLAENHLTKPRLNVSVP